MTLFTRNLLIAFAAFTILGCASAPKPPTMTKDASPQLTETEATYRALQVKNTHYDLYFDVSKKENFSGISTIHFDLKKIYNGLRIDFYDGKISKVILNGKQIEVVYNSHFLFVAPEFLKEGPTQLEIHFSRKYSNDGDGLHQFIDPKDNQRYLYTNLEPFDANKVFPMFDQPDIKATYKMDVLAPSNWTVVTSVRESEVSRKVQNKLWTFPKSAKFSTYIWSLHGGPFHIWEDTAGDIPLRLMARKSLSKYVVTKDWFTFTKLGFEFFNKYFDYKYPYKKYDQLIVPEFNPGAMENVGAVTFNERYISKGTKTDLQRQGLSNVILHEMAHMWFGNLVTMKWWDDLWLNESFATYMASLAQSTNGIFKDSAWRSFQGTKGWAYWEDQLVTTHPIEAVVPNTLQAMANFDGITYGKGASSLKQLAFYLGPEKFQKGVQIYFKKYAEQNTKLKDFMGALEDGSGRDLKNWQKMWLQTSGVNTVTANFDCKAGKVTDFSLTQTAHPDHNHSRPHALNIAFLKQNGTAAYTIDHKIKVELSDQVTPVPQLVGKTCPAIVYPNYDDHGYVKVKLDPVSLSHLKQGIAFVEDDFLRDLFWRSLWDMVVFAELSFEAFGEMILTASLRNEKDPFIIGFLMSTLVGRSDSSASILNFAAAKDGVTSKKYQQYLSRLENLLFQRLTRAKRKSELQKHFFNSLVAVTETQLGQKRLLNILNGKKTIRGFKIDQEKRWSLIGRLARLGHPRAKKLIQTEERLDRSHRGKLSASSAKAALPKWSIKEKWLNTFMSKDPGMSFTYLRYAMYSLFPRTQGKLRQKYSEQFFKNMVILNSGSEDQKARVFTSVAPNQCVTEKNQIGEFLASEKSLKPGALKRLRIINQEYERCRQAVALARSQTFR